MAFLAVYRNALMTFLPVYRDRLNGVLTGCPITCARFRIWLAHCARELSSETATLECLGRIAERNPAINAYIAVLADQALAQAQQADAARRRS